VKIKGENLLRRGRERAGPGAGKGLLENHEQRDVAGVARA